MLGEIYLFLTTYDLEAAGLVFYCFTANPDTKKTVKFSIFSISNNFP